MNGLQNTSTDTMFAPLTTRPQEGNVSASESHNNNSLGTNAFAGILESLGIDKPLPDTASSLASMSFPDIQSVISAIRENGFFTDTPTLRPQNDTAQLNSGLDLQARQDALLAITNTIHENGFIAFDLPLDNTASLEIDINALQESEVFLRTMFNATNALTDEALSDLVPIIESTSTAPQNPLGLDVAALLSVQDLRIAHIPVGEALSLQTSVATNASTTLQGALQSNSTSNLPIEAILSQEDLLTLSAPIGELLSRPTLAVSDDTPQKAPPFRTPVSEVPTDSVPQKTPSLKTPVSETVELQKQNTETLTNQFGNINTQSLQTTAPISESSNTPATQTSALAVELAPQSGGAQTNLGGENKQSQPIPTPLPLSNEAPIAANTNIGAIEQLQQIFTMEASNVLSSTSTNALKAVSSLPPAALSHMAVQQVGNALLQSGVEKGSDIVIRLDPAELGRVNISFTFDKTNGVTANIAAETSSTAAILRERADVLATQLKQSGFDNVNLNFDTRGDSQSDKGFGSQFSNQQQDAQQQPRVFDITPQLEQETLQTNTMRAQKMYSGTDAIDIKL